MGLAISSLSEVDAASHEGQPESPVDHEPGSSPPDANLQINESDGHTRGRQAEAGAEDSLDFACHKRTRTMGLEALLVFPKLALAEMLLPVDAADTAELPCGPRIAAERVRMFRTLDDSVPLSVNATYYRQLFLRDRLQTVAALKATPDSLAASWWGGEEAAEGTGIKDAERSEEQFDFLSLPSLAAMDAGMCLRPSWNEMAPHVGTVQSIKKLLQQMERELQQIKAKLGELDAPAASLQPSPTCGAAKSGRRDSCKRGVESDSTASEPHEMSEQAAAVLGSRTGRGAMSSESRDAQSVMLSQTDAFQEELQLEHQSPEGKLSLFLRGRERRAAERAQQEAEALELEKDIAVLSRACLELEALLRRVWNAERLAEDARIERVSFRHLWCHPSDDPQQIETADRLFALCHANCKRQRASSLGFSSAGMELSETASSEVAERQNDCLSFIELLDQLPPKALECLWCSAELRRKERQNYRYFWI
ncbi:hypothetical protein Emag_005859 [Eimeria magna]